MRLALVLVSLSACGPRMLAPADLPNLHPGAPVKVHVWAPGTPGPGHVVKGTFQSQDDAKIVVRDSNGQVVEILKGEIHDDTRNIP